MADKLDQEVAAIRTVLGALEPLEPGIRASVLDYVLRRLGIASSAPSAITPARLAGDSATSAQASSEIHIKAFKEQKNPKTANEMAAIVAYYLANLAPTSDRKDAIKAKDIETQFKIAEFPLRSRFVLPNARSAGYLDSVGDGAYRLNAVGHNLVVHNLPRKGGATGGGSRPRKKGRGSRSRRKK